MDRRRRTCSSIGGAANVPRDLDWITATPLGWQMTHAEVWGTNSRRAVTQETAAPVLPQRQVHGRLHPRPTRRRRRPTQRPPSTDPGLEDTITSTRTSVALTT